MRLYYIQFPLNEQNFLPRLSLWIHMKRVSWPPAWWTTVSTLLKSASVELYPAPASTASVPWSTTPTLCWSLTSGTHSFSFLFTFSVLPFVYTFHVLCPCALSSLHLSGRCCIINCGRASQLRLCRTSSVASAARSVWCRAAYSRASSTHWVSRALRTPRLLFW